MDVLKEALAVELFRLLLEENLVLVSALGLEVIFTEFSAAIAARDDHEAGSRGVLPR